MTQTSSRLPLKKIIILAGYIVVLLTGPCMADELRVMEYSEDYPPVFFREKGQARGIVPDVLTSIAAITGDTFVYVKAPFPRLQLMFENNEIDIEPSVNPSWRENANIKGSYTIPYGESVNVFIFPDAKSVFECSSPDDFKGKLFGTVRGYSYPELQPYLESGLIHHVTCSDEAKLMQLLAQGRIDVTAIYKPFAQYHMKKKAAYRNFALGRELSHLDIMMRFHPTQKAALDRFNKAIRQLKQSGRIEQIHARYR